MKLDFFVARIENAKKLASGLDKLLDVVEGGQRISHWFRHGERCRRG